MTGGLQHPPAADELQAQLRDLLCLAVAGDHVRWVVTGDGASELGDWLADAVPEWRSMADLVAKLLVRLGVAPDGRVRSLSEDIPLNWVPDGWLRPDEARRLVEYRLRSVAGRAEQRRSQSTGAETARLFKEISTRVGAQARVRGDLALVYLEHERVNKNAAARTEQLRRRSRPL
jgi:DNA-binding ferritin-like protein